MLLLDMTVPFKCGGPIDTLKILGYLGALFFCSFLVCNVLVPSLGSMESLDTDSPSLVPEVLPLV